MSPTRDRLAFERAKRILDVLLAALALVVLAPVMLVVAIGIRVSLGSPIFFKQERGGRHGRRFTILKFRPLSMADAFCCGEPRACRGLHGPSDELVSRFARFLRRSGLDEVPQLVAVVRGEMSLIGPRPLLVRYLPRYTQEQARRHEVLPGITGLAQVNGRTNLSWDQRFALDIYYVDHRSLTLDAKIAWRSIAAVWQGQGFSQGRAGTGLEFLGQGIRSDFCPVTLGPVPGGFDRDAQAE